MVSSADRAVATALAHAFLAGDWTRAGLVDRGAVVLGARRRWLGPLCRELLGYRRDPPVDGARELAALITALGPFVRAADSARQRGRPLRCVGLTPVVAAMGPRRWPVPPLAGLAELASLLSCSIGQLDWLADVQRRRRRQPAGALHVYRYRWLRRPGRVPRLLEAPTGRLRQAQRVLLHEVLALIPAHAAAHGFVPGRSAVSGARQHVGADVLATFDLVAFFDSVRAGRVYGLLRTAGYPEAVAHSVTGLCTNAPPLWVLREMPPGGATAERAQLRAALAEPHLPQGAPSSPHLANLAGYRLDVRLAGYAEAVGATYTRYADDLAFSGGPALRHRAEALVDAVERICTDEGFRLNRHKTRIRAGHSRQRVTGIVVNDRTNVARADYDRLRALLHNAARTGPAEQNRDAVPDFRAHLLGRIAWVDATNPRRGAKLRAAFDRISW